MTFKKQRKQLGDGMQSLSQVAWPRLGALSKVARPEQSVPGLRPALKEGRLGGGGGCCEVSMEDWRQRRLPTSGLRGPGLFTKLPLHRWGVGAQRLQPLKEGQRAGHPSAC